jgi:hypothetical protein
MVDHHPFSPICHLLKVVNAVPRWIQNVFGLVSFFKGSTGKAILLDAGKITKRFFISTIIITIDRGGPESNDAFARK